MTCSRHLEVYVYVYLCCSVLFMLTTMASSLALILLSAAFLSFHCPLATSMEEMEMMGEESGYYKREHSLVAPYQGQ